MVSALLLIIFFCFVQGFTEFLPISSQGHLIVYNEFFGINLETSIPIKEANILAHFGSLIAVIIFYSKTLKDFIFSLKLIDRPDIDKNSFLVVNLFISTLPIVLVGYFFYKIFNYEDEQILFLIGLTSIIFGIILFAADSFSLRIKNHNALSYFNSFLIGLFQCLALIPGVSRSGAILTVMRFFGYQRKFCVYYSNLLSIPVISAATSLMIYNQYNFLTTEFIFSSSGIMIFTLSFIFSLCFIFFFVAWVKKFSLSIFVIYRVLFGIAVIYFLV